MKILFCLINMNLGGTEKSLLSLLKKIPNDCKIDLLLLENKGILLNEIPNNVRVLIIKNNKIINEYIKLGSRKFGIQQLKKGKLSLFLKCAVQFIMDKLNCGNQRFWPIHSYIELLPEKYDISIAYTGVHNFISYYVTKNTRANKKIQWIHFDVREVIFNKNFGNKYYQYFDNIFCVSENAKLAFDGMFQQYINKTSVFKNIVSKGELEKLALKGETFIDNFQGLRIITLGRLSSEKGQQMIPSVVERLKKEGFDFRWYLIGDGKLKLKLDKQIKALDIESHLIILGAKLNPHAFLKDCDLYVQTSLHEGYCLTIHEAKMFNKPVITTAVASASNLILDGEDGLIVPISEEGIYNGIFKLLVDKELRKKFSKSILAKDTTNEINKLFPN